MERLLNWIVFVIGRDDESDQDSIDQLDKETENCIIKW